MNKKLTIEDILNEVNKISFAPSNLDMGWEYQVKAFCVDDGECGFLIRTSFMRPDTNTGKIDRGFGRWYVMSADISLDGVVKTAWMCAEQIVKHELMEAFMHEEVRIFDPHKSLEQLKRK